MTPLRLRIAYTDRTELRRALEDEIARGVLLVRVTPPESLAFRDPVAVEITTPRGTLALDTEVVSILPGVGVAIAIAADRLAAARALVDALGDGGAAVHEIVTDDPARAPMGSVLAEKIRLARHGTREDRNALLRDPNRMLHALVIKCPQVTIDEVAAWARNAQLGPDFLRQIADRKDWLSRPNVALGLARNPKTPADIAVRTLDYVGDEALRQMIKGAGVPPNVAAAARKKLMRK